MAIFTLAQLKEKHPNEQARRILTLDDIRQEAETKKITEGDQFKKE